MSQKLLIHSWKRLNRNQLKPNSSNNNASNNNNNNKLNIDHKKSKQINENYFNK